MKNGIFLMILTILVSCQTGETKLNSQPEHNLSWKNQVTYEIFVQSFCDSNGDGIGDLQGVISKLDYIKSLGAGAIWLMPISPSSTYHKYEVNDYRSIDPDFGTMEDFRQLIAEAQKRDIKVVIDLVLNHTSWEHPWFQSAKEGHESPYYDYYVWDYPDSVEKEFKSREKQYDTDNLSQWNTLEGMDKSYYSFFYKSMPDLNFDNPMVRKEVFEIGEFWLNQGVDGFRLDAAKYIYREHRMDETIEFWAEFRNEMRQINPEVMLVGEVWADADIVAPFYKGLDACFNFELSFSIEDAINGKAAATSILDTFNRIDKQNTKVNPEYINATFLKNHDQDRFFSVVEEDERKARLGITVLMTLPGAPYLYYGEEIGMRGMKPDEYIREPMIWSGGGTENTKWMEPKYNLPGSIDSVEEQEQDSQSMLSFYRTLIQIRNTSPALYMGDIVPITDAPEGILAYHRSTLGQKIRVFHNMTDKEKLIPVKDYSSVKFKSGLIGPNKTGFRIGPYSSIILMD